MQVGDQIVEVDGQSLVGAENKEAVRILHKSDNRVKITLLRDPIFLWQIHDHLAAMCVSVWWLRCISYSLLRSLTSFPSLFSKSKKDDGVIAGALGTPSVIDASTDYGL